ADDRVIQKAGPGSRSTCAAARRRAATGARARRTAGGWTPGRRATPSARSRRAIWCRSHGDSTHNEEIVEHSIMLEYSARDVLERSTIEEPVMATTTVVPGYVTGTWTIDPVHTDVSFSVRHMMVSKVRGR